MENPRPEKVAVVEEVRQKLEGADAVLLTEYRGLTVTELGALRNAMRPAGGEFKVYKNTLASFAARNAGVDGLADLLTGPSAITFIDGDAAAVAKTLRDAAKANPLLVLKGGVIGGKVEYRTDRNGNVHVPLGKASFTSDALVANLGALLDELQRAKPAAAKGRYFRKITVSTTMGPGIKVDPARVGE